MKRISRCVSLCAIFCPSDENQSIAAKDRAAFEEFWVDAKSHVQRAKRKHQRVREKEMALKKARLEERLQKLHSVAALIGDALADRTSKEEAARAIHELIPDRETKEEFFEIFKTTINEKPEDAAKREQEIAQQEEEILRMENDIDRREKLLRANEAISKGIFVLTDALRAGDADAARCLAEVAIYAGLLIREFETLKPELFRRVAKWEYLWPVLARDETGWEKEAAHRIAELGVGDELVPFKARFRVARGYDENLPARRWAKAAVRTIEETRLRFLRFGHMLRDFGSSEALTDFCLDRGWDLRSRPKWMEKIGSLGNFTKASEAKWAAAIRKMVREEMPDFQSCPEWQNQRNAAKASGRNTKGLVQNRILDDICDALESIAPKVSG